MNCSFFFLVYLRVIRPTFKRVLKAKSTEQFVGLPYLFSLLNCCICLWYGLPWVSDGRLLVATVNGTGAVFQLAYIWLFIFYADSRKTLGIPPVTKIYLLSFFDLTRDICNG
jgi:solute carrier family 50 (sugar transporter)